MKKEVLRNYSINAFTAVVYFIMARFCLSLGMMNHRLIVIFLPTGIALIILLKYGIRKLWGITAGILAALVLKGYPVVTIIGIVFGHIASLTVIYHGFLNTRFRQSLERVKDIGWLVWVTASGSVAGMVLILTALKMGDFISWSRMADFFLVSVLAEVVSVLAVTATFLCWSKPQTVKFAYNHWRLLEFGLFCGITMTALNYFSVHQLMIEPDDIFILFPILIWVSLRFYVRGAATLSSLVTFTLMSIFMVRTLNGDLVINGLWILEIILGGIITISLLLAAAITEKEIANAEMKLLNQNLEQRVFERTEKLLDEIHERAHIEEALRGSEEKFRNIVESLDDGLVLFDIQGRIQEWNHGLEVITGLDRNRVLGRDIVDIVSGLVGDENKAQSFQNVISRRITEKKVFSDFEIAIRRPDGTIRIVQETQFQMQLQQNFYYGNIVHDITEQRQNENTILENTRRLEILRKIDRTILQASAPEKLAGAILPNLRKLINCQRICIVTYSPKNDACLLAIDTEGSKIWPDGTIFSSKVYQIPQGFYRGEIVLMEDLRALKEENEAQAILIAAGIYSYLGVPLLVEGELIGAIHLGSTMSGTICKEQIEIVRDVANGLAIAIHQSELVKQVNAGREQLRQLTQSVVVAQEEERRRISRELHDEAGQALTALKINLELILKNPIMDRCDLRNELNTAVRLVDDTMEEIRLLARGLRPPALDAIGLNLTLKELCSDFSRRTHLSVDYAGEELPLLPDMINICFYRLLQESFTNILKHAQATKVSVKLQKEEQKLCLSVEDNGRGFERQFAERNISGIGLLGMKERLMMLNGKIEIKSQIGNGTKLLAYIPWEDNYD